MKFIFGVVVGTALGPHAYRALDKKYGHVIVPYLLTLGDRFDAWAKAKEAGWK
jgi:hypothetical protein